jgi:hypothetical protein
MGKRIVWGHLQLLCLVLSGCWPKESRSPDILGTIHRNDICFSTLFNADSFCFIFRASSFCLSRSQTSAFSSKLLNANLLFLVPKVLDLRLELIIATKPSKVVFTSTTNPLFFRMSYSVIFFTMITCFKILHRKLEKVKCSWSRLTRHISSLIAGYNSIQDGRMPLCLFIKRFLQIPEKFPFFYAVISFPSSKRAGAIWECIWVRFVKKPVFEDITLDFIHVLEYKCQHHLSKNKKHSKKSK